jgi:hypothetical protein
MNLKSKYMAPGKQEKARINIFVFLFCLQLPPLTRLSLLKGLSGAGEQSKPDDGWCEKKHWNTKIDGGKNYFHSMSTYIYGTDVFKLYK